MQKVTEIKVTTREIFSFESKNCARNNFFIKNLSFCEQAEFIERVTMQQQQTISHLTQELGQRSQTAAVTTYFYLCPHPFWTSQNLLHFQEIRQNVWQ